MDILRDEDVKTRKDHRCFGCLEIIPKGSIAHVQVNTDAGYLGSIYTHRSCEKIMKEISRDMYHGDTLEEGCVTEYLRDERFEGTPDEYVKIKEVGDES